MVVVAMEAPLMVPSKAIPEPQELVAVLVQPALQLRQQWQEMQEQMDLVQLVEQQEMVAMRVVRELRLHL